MGAGGPEGIARQRARRCRGSRDRPAVTIAVNGRSIVIQDNGPGIPAKTIEGILDYSIRVSSREAYVSPTRGAQGNALKTILPMAYVLEERHGDNAAGETIIEAAGVAHHIRFSVDHIRQEPRIEHARAPSTVVYGTRITVELPLLIAATTNMTFSMETGTDFWNWPKATPGSILT